ncbi:alpha/beta fold hydrolase [Spongisporangium articulatum]|uniref:Alpha/beta fold hydrolase n=1 Tax=Spongisporangium articulatum TaxID=3362603 RepID=A0ABW8AHK9_9ACTN
MTWWQAYGRDKAINQVINQAAKQNAENPVNEETQVFTGNYTPGTKPLTVVLLPALFVGDWMWEGIYNRLNAEGWPVIQFTESISLIDRQTARSINRVAARLLEATRQHTSQPLVVAGDSLGGLIAFEFARSFPDETAGLVASGAPGLNLKVQEFARNLAQDVTSPTEFADKFLGKLLYDPNAHDIDPERYEKVVEELAEPDNLTSMMSAVRAISRYNSRKIVMEIDTPKLFIWGKHDEITPVEDWERALPRMKNARLVSFEECGHAPMFEKPDDFYRELVTFLNELVANMTPEQLAQAEAQKQAIEQAAAEVNAIEQGSTGQ